MLNITASEMEAIMQGGLFIFPTETVLGLGVLFGKDYSGIYEIKGREFTKPLSLHLTRDMDFRRFWKEDLPEWVLDVVLQTAPGPFTYIYYKNHMVLPDSMFPFEKVGLRFPDDECFLSLAGQLKTPVWGTSANLSGEEAAREANELPESILHKMCCIISGRKTSGKGSTVVDLTRGSLDMMVLRQGDGDINRIRPFLGGARS